VATTVTSQQFPPLTLNETDMDETHGVVNEVVNNTSLSFKDEYAQSIKPIMAKVDSLFERFMWRGVPIATHPPSSDDDQEKLLAIPPVVVGRKGPSTSRVLLCRAVFALVGEDVDCDML